MTEMTVFYSNLKNLIKEADKLRELKVQEGFFAKALSLVGRASVSEEALTAHNKLIDKTIQSYTDNMNTMLSLTEQMKKEGDYNNIIMERMSDHINKLKLSLAAQKQDIINSNKIITNYKETTEKLETDNASIQEANKTLTTQNESQQQQNLTLTAQNESQKKTIATMEENLARLTRTLAKQSAMITQQTAKFKSINDSNRSLNIKLKELTATQRETENKGKIAAAEFEKIKKAQDAHIKDINAAQKIRVAFLRNSAKNKLKKQQEEFQKSIAEIKQESGNSIKDKEAQIKKMTEEHTKAQNKINTQLNNIQATSNATIGDLRTELSKFKTEEQLGKEDQEKQKKMLRTVTRVFPLSWKNSKGFNIGNITTQLRGNKPYQANDTIDHYLHTLFNDKNQGQSEISISSRHVPIIKTSGGKKSKKSKKSKNNKTKKQRGQR